MDFTLELYKYLFEMLQSQRYKIIRFDDSFSCTGYINRSKTTILRHDVDLLPHNALAMAQLEHDLGIRGTYYFRIVPESFDAGIIERIAAMGHEIGYHYEDVDLVVKRQKANGRGQRSVGGVRIGESEYRCIGDMEKRAESEILKPAKQTAGRPETWNLEPETDNRQPTTDLIDRAMESFLKNLDTMRNIADIKTICMHGSPMSKYDNRLLWTKYDYRDYGIIGEPYFDVDFSQIAYYTDTGRRWDGDSVSVRDKVVLGGRSEVRGDRENRSTGVSEKRRTDNRQPTTDNLFPKFRTTHEMIRAIEENRFPRKAMITIHPQRWHDRAVPWVKELVWQRCKNLVKRVVVAVR